LKDYQTVYNEAKREFELTNYRRPTEEYELDEIKAFMAEKAVFLEPGEVVAHWESCCVCRGKGQVNSGIRLSLDDSNREITCIWCKGRGKKLVEVPKKHD